MIDLKLLRENPDAVRGSQRPHWAEPPARFQEFRQWAEQRVERLRRHCSAEALQEALANSPLFGPDPKPPGYWPRYTGN